MLKAVLFKSERRFSAFKEEFTKYGVNCQVLDFEKQDWIHFDYSDIDFIVYFSFFKYSSNHPLALYQVHDNLMHIISKYPHIKMFPDPNVIKYYCDKYRQYLLLESNNYPIPETYPLFSDESLDLAESRLGYPIILKNRYGAGGDFVFKVSNRKELEKYYKVSTLNLFNGSSARHFFNMISKRIFYYHLIKEKRMFYPFLSPPLLAQKFIKIKRDLKTVVGNCKVVEAHWRLKSDENMWKMNIDGGGIGEWSYIPKEARDISESLARHLNAIWLNIDLIESEGKFLITEFSPIWHHYAYKEKPSFVYREDYNIGVPLEVSLDLERIIVESLVNSVQKKP